MHPAGLRRSHRFSGIFKTALPFYASGYCDFMGKGTEFAAALLDVIDIEHSRSPLPDECFQPCLALHEWQLAKIITIEK